MSESVYTPQAYLPLQTRTLDITASTIYFKVNYLYLPPADFHSI